MTKKNHICAHIISKKVPTVLLSATIGSTQTILKKNIKNFETIDYIYVTDKDQKLLGVFSVRDVFSHSPETKIETIYTHTNLVTVKPETDQEEAAYLSLKFNIKEIPVVDKSGKFFGVISNDNLMKILHKELRKDILQLGGIHKAQSEYENVFDVPLFTSIKHRLPWLIIGSMGGFFAAGVIGFFENTLEKNIILATFIPLVVYIADAVGTQLEAFVIRDFALFRKVDFLKYFAKQFMTVSLMALILGALLGVVSFLIYGRTDISIVLSLAIISAILSALVSGLCVPFLFRKLHFDPAGASGPIGTIIQDVASVIIYFAIATVIL